MYIFIFTFTRRILSPLRLPIPPHKHYLFSYFVYFYKIVNTKVFKSLASGYLSHTSIIIQFICRPAKTL
jgi:hypothetical protein